jgi:23S rRNA (adenine1618-N6)-methyltransferase
MVWQSKLFAHSCFWFSTLISKQDNLNSVYAELKKVQAVAVKTIQMSQGNKISRLVAWTFQSEEQQKAWIKARWKT